VKKINIVIPVFNEAESIEELVQVVVDFTDSLDFEFSITLVDDGSTDNSWNLIEQINSDQIKIQKIKLSRNFGPEAAVFAGLEKFDEDALLIIDGDFQDNPKYIPALIKKWIEGNDIVLARRTARSEGIFRRLMTNFYYSLQNRISEIIIPKNVGHYCLLDKKIVKEIVSFPEKKKFLIGVRAYVGFKVAFIDVVREKRKYGKPKMNLKKLIKLSTEGLIGFSTAPLYFIGIIGLILSIGTLILSLYIVLFNNLLEITTMNISFELFSLYFLSGVQLLSLSILGQYIAKIFDETKGRPQYIIEKYLNFE
jgi:glycosyltransferase involved in cell wall biosynthesis